MAAHAESDRGQSRGRELASWQRTDSGPPSRNSLRRTRGSGSLEGEEEKSTLLSLSCSPARPGTRLTELVPLLVQLVQQMPVSYLRPTLTALTPRFILSLLFCSSS